MQMLRRPKGSRARSGFTLTELLVVIAIIGVLAGILIPVIGHARASGNTTRCAANMRHIGLQLLTYAAGNKGVTISANEVEADGSWSTWQKQLAVYDGTYEHLIKATGGTVLGENTDYGVWRCPENTVQERVLSGATIGEIHCSYGINGWADSDNGTRYTKARVASFTNPAKFYMLTEACYFRMELNVNTGANTVPAGLYSTGPNNLRYAHGGRINMVFADGHLETLQGPLENRGSVLSSSGTNAARFSNGVHWYSY